MSKSVKPGQKAPDSGIWRPTKGGPRVTVSEGERMPPTKKGGGFVMDTPTKK